MLVNADKIRGMRLENGWTQDQLAQMCGVSVRTVQRIEKTGVASLDTANALAAVFKAERKAILAQGGVGRGDHHVQRREEVVVVVERAVRQIPR